MTIRGNAPVIEPSAEAIQAARACVHQMGFLLTPDAARELVRTILGVESVRLDRRAREAAAACLRNIQDAAHEALAILAHGAAPATVPVQPVSPAKAAPAPPRDKPVNLAEVVRQRLADDLPPDPPARRPNEPLGPPPAAPGPLSRSGAEPRRPVFKRPRGR